MGARCSPSSLPHCTGCNKIIIVGGCSWKLLLRRNLGCLALPRPSSCPGLSQDDITKIHKTKQPVQRKHGSMASAFQKQKPPKSVSRSCALANNGISSSGVRDFCWNLLLSVVRFELSKHRLPHHLRQCVSLNSGNAASLVVVALHSTLSHFLPSASALILQHLKIKD